MNVTRIKSGVYAVSLHGQTFTLEKSDYCWLLWNAKQTEINRSETKGGMLELMRHWSPEHCLSESEQEFCVYA